jgi:hypothetical protein
MHVPLFVAAHSYTPTTYHVLWIDASLLHPPRPPLLVFGPRRAMIRHMRRTCSMLLLPLCLSFLSSFRFDGSSPTFSITPPRLLITDCRPGPFPFQWRPAGPPGPAGAEVNCCCRGSSH